MSPDWKAKIPWNRLDDLHRSGILDMSGLVSTTLNATETINLGSSASLPFESVPFANEMFSFFIPYLLYIIGFKGQSLRIGGRLQAEGSFEFRRINLPSSDTPQVFDYLKRRETPNRDTLLGLRLVCHHYRILYAVKNGLTPSLNFDNEDAVDLVLRILVDMNCYMEDPSISWLQGRSDRGRGYYRDHLITETELDIALVTVIACKYAHDKTYNGYTEMTGTGNSK
eukprot:GHVO01048976.1.p2 GENE.GHVO01048976.1~~GHVO01048976.1.p2  ORF type:complete len:226 (-),score=25.47 GHVO01048976.1:1180-1857(-)